MLNNQSYLFFVFTLNGILIGIIFDFFRVLRKSFETKDVITYIEDICFWLIAGITIIYSMYIFCDGELRFFMVLGLGMGIAIYITTISRYVIKVFAIFLNVLKSICSKMKKLVKKRGIFCKNRE